MLVTIIIVLVYYIPMSFGNREKKVDDEMNKIEKIHDEDRERERESDRSKNEAD